MHRLLLAGLALGGCAEAPALSIEKQGLYCDEHLCTGNTAVVVGKAFGELHEGGALSPKGFKIVQAYTPDGAPAQLQVDGPWPRLVRGDGSMVSGIDMVWSTIVLETPHPAQNHQLSLLITEYHPIPYFDEQPGPRIAGFRIEYQYFDEKIGTWLPADLCPYEEVDELGVAGTSVILSQGDRFGDDASIIATGAAVGGWFNVSCAGAVPGKLLKIRHAMAAADGTHMTELDQREAALRMFTAKYCKDGPLYTVTGQPLTWEDYAPWSKPIRSRPEAIWTADGAYCLVEPRYADPKDIACDIPRCTSEELKDWRAHGWLLSRIPY